MPASVAAYIISKLWSATTPITEALVYNNNSLDRKNHNKPWEYELVGHHIFYSGI